MRFAQPNRPEIRLVLLGFASLAGLLGVFLTAGPLPVVPACGLMLAAFFFGRLTARHRRVEVAAGLAEPAVGPVPEAPPFVAPTGCDTLHHDFEPENDNVVLLENERQSRAIQAQSAASDMGIVSAQLGQYPAYADMLSLQLQSVTNVSQSAAENLLASLLEVDRRVTALMGFLQSAGSSDSSERILGRIEDQLSGCRGHLSSLGAQQEQAAADADHFQIRLAEETQNVLGVLNDVQRIARQTTMLSLNVSIEAARVGDLGKGFAVIAHEIRSLASEVQQLADDVHERVSGLMFSVRGDLESQAQRRRDNETVAMGHVEDSLSLLTTNLMLLLQHQREVLGRIRSENEDIAEPIMAMMGSIQFQDIVRQQIEQIVAMAQEVKTHLAVIKQGLDGDESLADIEMLAEKLDKLFSNYVMREQRDIHDTVLGKAPSNTAAVAAIELF